ncbi:hypothetical protein FWJ25_06720 [Marinobacter salinexigens]|uniref:Uncharacterized protein n=1 Tax=Marinobacter salinexigens TaxID=2919747 RepID=A0A5B0VK44_9GAMM|nr:hypothetical protein [Marinobacter salinexigens]KAA1175057.1 hypothetical protein FWJ25_06720 [Marinobacter salinexigens]
MFNVKFGEPLTVIVCDGKGNDISHVDYENSKLVPVNFDQVEEINDAIYKAASNLVLIVPGSIDFSCAELIESMCRHRRLAVSIGVNRALSSDENEFESYQAILNELNTLDCSTDGQRGAKEPVLFYRTAAKRVGYLDSSMEQDAWFYFFLRLNRYYPIRISGLGNTLASAGYESGHLSAELFYKLYNSENNVEVRGDILLGIVSILNKWSFLKKLNFLVSTKDPAFILKVLFFC